MVQMQKSRKKPKNKANQFLSHIFKSAFYRHNFYKYQMIHQ